MHNLSRRQSTPGPTTLQPPLLHPLPRSHGPGKSKRLAPTAVNHCSASTIALSMFSSMHLRLAWASKLILPVLGLVEFRKGDYQGVCLSLGALYLFGRSSWQYVVSCSVMAKIGGGARMGQRFGSSWLRLLLVWWVFSLFARWWMSSDMFNGELTERIAEQRMAHCIQPKRCDHWKL